MTEKEILTSSSPMKGRVGIVGEIWAETTLRLFILVSGGGFAVVFLGYVVKFRGGLSNDPAIWALFGDYVGGLLAAFLGLLSLWLILITVYFTYRTLQLTEETHKLTSNKFEETQRQMERQNFDGRAFFLLKMFQEVSERLVTKVDSNDPHMPLGAIVELRGVGVIAEEYSELIAQTKNYSDENHPQPGELKQLITDFDQQTFRRSGSKPYFVCLNSVVNELEDMERRSADVGETYKRLLASIIGDAEAIASYLYSAVAEIDRSLDAFEGRSRKPIREFLSSFVMPNLTGQTALALYALDAVLPQVNQAD